MLSLNAPYGARCFLTLRRISSTRIFPSLNAPYGARCFLTQEMKDFLGSPAENVLMHLMALGAF